MRVATIVLTVVVSDVVRCCENTGEYGSGPRENTGAGTTPRDVQIGPRIVLAAILRALRLGGSRQPVSVWLPFCTPIAHFWLTWLQQHCSGVKGALFAFVGMHIQCSSPRFCRSRGIGQLPNVIERKRPATVSRFQCSDYSAVRALAIVQSVSRRWSRVVIL